MLETTRLTGWVFTSTGEPFTGPMTLALNRSAIDADSGIVLAITGRKIQPDQNGFIDVRLWPTARAEKPTFYRLTAGGFTMKLAVPDQPEIDLVAALVSD